MNIIRLEHLLITRHKYLKNGTCGELNVEYSVFSYYIAPIADFKTELLSHGSEIEALAPEWLRSDMAGIIKNMNKLYE